MSGIRICGMIWYLIPHWTSTYLGTEPKRKLSLASQNGTRSDTAALRF
jgi:hypothetical protein